MIQCSQVAQVGDPKPTCDYGDDHDDDDDGNNCYNDENDDELCLGFQDLLWFHNSKLGQSLQLRDYDVGVNDNNS